MSNRCLTILVSALLVLASNSAAGDTADPIAQLSWFSGHWRGTVGDVEMEEFWTTADGGTLVGLHKDVDRKRGRLLLYEFLRIARSPDGQVCYYGSPMGREPVPFCLVAQEARRVVFENRAHDFPQRILYWLDAEDRLHARVEGPQGAPEVGEEWTWERVAAAAR